MINSQRGIETCGQGIKSHVLLLAFRLVAPSAGVLIVCPLELLSQVVSRDIESGVRVVVAAFIGDFASLTAVARPFSVALQELQLAMPAVHSLQEAILKNDSPFASVADTRYKQTDCRRHRGAHRPQRRRSRAEHPPWPSPNYNLRLPKLTNS